MNQKQRRTAWSICVGIPYCGLLFILLGRWIRLFLPLGTAVQVGGLLGFEGAYSRCRLLPAAAELRRGFYRSTVWALAFLPCQLLWMLPLYPALCLLATWLLRPKAQSNTGHPS